jgi:hypothetical protein
MDQLAGRRMAQRSAGRSDRGAHERVLPAARRAPVLLRRAAGRITTTRRRPVPGQSSPGELRRPLRARRSRRRRSIDALGRIACRRDCGDARRLARYRAAGARACSGTHQAGRVHLAAHLRSSRQRDFSTQRCSGLGARIRLERRPRRRRDVHQMGRRRHRRLVFRRPHLLEVVYAGFSLEAGKYGAPLVPGSFTGTLKSASLFLGADTPVGPLYFGYGHSADGNSSFYLFLGRP